MRTFFLPLIIAVAPLTAHAELEVPDFKKGGFLITLGAGAGVPHLDEGNLNQQFTPLIAGLYTGRVQTAAAVDLRLGYNILGHATIGVDFSATGWDVFNDRRGGAGFLVGFVAWHPMQLFFLQKDKRPFGLDFATHVGVGYGISGVAGPPALGQDGLIVQWGANIDFFFNRYFGLEFFWKCNFLQWDRFYFDWDGAHQNPPSPGAAAAINPKGNGTWWSVGAAIVLRVGD